MMVKRLAHITRAIVALIGILALLLVSASACGGKPQPAMTVYYQVEQPAQTSQEILTVVSTEKTGHYPVAGVINSLLYTYVDAPPTTEFIIVEVTVINIGQGALGVSRNDFSLKDSEGRKYPTAAYKGFNNFADKKLSPGQTNWGHIAFVVPDIATGFELSCVLLGSTPVLGVWQLPY
jgi:hypothetical protein